MTEIVRRADRRSVLLPLLASERPMTQRGRLLPPKPSFPLSPLIRRPTVRLRVEMDVSLHSSCTALSETPLSTCGKLVRAICQNRAHACCILRSYIHHHHSGGENLR